MCFFAVFLLLGARVVVLWGRFGGTPQGATKCYTFKVLINCEYQI